MTNIFKALAPRWKRVVRKYALDIWKKRDDKKSEHYFTTQAELFSRRYAHDLRQYYENKDIKIYRGTIDGKVNDWLARQRATQQTLQVIAAGKKDKLVAEEFAKLQKAQGEDVQKMLNRMYAAREGESVYRVFSFAENFKDRAEQIGEETAFELGTDINNAVLGDIGDAYLWQNQGDARVRYVHDDAPKGLGGLVFLFSDPPTTIDLYGNVHTGNCGTAWGCRCYAEKPPKGAKPKRHYTVREKKSKSR